MSQPEEPTSRPMVRPSDGIRTGRSFWLWLGELLPQRSDYDGLSTSWRGDIVAGFTVGVVALPLALAFGIASGLSAQAGLVTAIIAGLVAAVFGGSSVQVSGPTGAMTVVLVPIVARHGVEAVFVVGLLAGTVIVAAGAAKFGRYLAFIPWPVIEGFTLGIAVIIFLQQVPAALGVPKPKGRTRRRWRFGRWARPSAGEGCGGPSAWSHWWSPSWWGYPASIGEYPPRSSQSWRPPSSPGSAAPTSA